MHFCELNKKEYEDFQCFHPFRNFLNGIETMELEEKEGWKTTYVGIKDKDQVICATPLVRMPTLKKFHFYYAPRGFLIDYHNSELLTYFITHLKAYAKRNQAVYLIVDPYILYQERDIDAKLVEGGFDNSYVIQALQDNGFIHKGFSNGYGHTMQWIRWMFTLSLQGKDEKIVFNEFHQLTKRSINKTNKFSIQIRELGYDELNKFDEIMIHTGARRNFECRDVRFYQNQVTAYKDKLKVLYAYLDCDLIIASVSKEKETKQLELLDVEKNKGSKKYESRKKMIEESLLSLQKKDHEIKMLKDKYGNEVALAASMFMCDCNEITYLTSGAYDELMHYNASYALQWYMIKYALKHGYERYNFYGISGEFDPSSKDYGVYKFKRGFNGQVEELIGDFILPVRKNLFKVYEWKHARR